MPKSFRILTSKFRLVEPEVKEYILFKALELGYYAHFYTKPIWQPRILEALRHTRSPLWIRALYGLLRSSHHRCLDRGKGRRPRA